MVDDGRQGWLTMVDTRESPRHGRTRERILRTALALFNEQGEANVTLAHIGTALGISEGNVWYHFHTKRELVAALFDELQGRIGAVQQIDLERLQTLTDIERLLEQGFRLMWEYRFLFRDHIRWTVGLPEVHHRLVELVGEGHAFIERILARLEELGVIRLTPDERSSLATNIWIVDRYWIDYCQLRGPGGAITEEAVRAGARQILALVTPYLTERRGTGPG